VRKPPYESPQRRWLPARLRAEILLRQKGRCADCGSRLVVRFFVFDHRPPLAIRDPGSDANDPERIAAICRRCNERKTPKDLKEIARAKRLAENHQEFVARQQDKVPGRRLPSRRQWQELQRKMRRSFRVNEDGSA